jgi:hypothetical protein
MARRRYLPQLGAACAALVFGLSLLAGCGGGTQDEGAAAAADAATAFLDALGNQELEELRSLMSRGYLESNAVPDPITSEQLIATLGYVNSYRFVPGEDVNVEGERAVITIDLELTGGKTSEETLVLALEEGAWKVDGFTAIDWSRQPVVEDADRVEAEQALRDFLIACIDGDTGFIFDHLSPAYKEKHHLEQPWSSADFSGVFGSARSYDFHPEDIVMEKATAYTDVTVEFGSRGNLESETSRVEMVREGADWLIDVFPFFIY